MYIFVIEIRGRHDEVYLRRLYSTFEAAEAFAKEYKNLQTRDTGDRYAIYRQILDNEDIYYTPDVVIDEKVINT